MDPSLKSSLNKLPEPDETAKQISQQLIETMIKEIKQNNGKIPFDRYMELALYSPGLGYYSGSLRKFGEQGDFITSPEISPLFGRCIGRQCAEVFDQINGADILEFGAGSGRLAADILLELNNLDKLPNHYYILELSADLRRRQQKLLEEEHPALFHRIQWLDQLPTNFRGVMVANEVLDAMPVSRFKLSAEGVHEQFVIWNGEQLTAQWQPAETADLEQTALNLAQRHSLGRDYESEINLRAEPWLEQLSQHMDRGLVLLIDYGYNTSEYYHPQRHTGTLICHYRHRVHSDPMVYPGLQDITANVDFTALAEAAPGVGFEQHAFTTQAYFLLAGGLEQLMASEVDPSNPQQQLQAIQAVKRLTLPDEMGERFKVLGLGK